LRGATGRENRAVPESLDAVVVGSGPNGLTAAVVLAHAGCSVRVLEAAQRIGGGTRTEELTLSGFRHDVCAAVLPLTAASPVFRALPLREHGLELVESPAPLAHPLDDGGAAVLERSPAATAESLGETGMAWRDLLEPLVRNLDALLADILRPPRLPRHPLVTARFARDALRPATAVAGSRALGRRGGALFAGCAAHSLLRLDRSPSAAFGLVLSALGHGVGWPLARGGTQAVADALAAHLHSLGGEIETGCRVRRLDDLPRARTVLLDLVPTGVLAVAGDRLPPRYRRALSRYRHAPGSCKVDWALAAPIPWRAPEAARAGAVHLGGTLEEVAAAEAAVAAGRHPERPFVILAQPTLFDPTRAPAGGHTAWAYCHVPSGSPADMTDAIEAQVERFAPGFREVVMARSTMSAADLERHNPNLVGGDVGGGLSSLRQILARPVARVDPYATPLPGVFVCSAATPPGGGVHGMCGALAARSALAHLRIPTA
jgi:phytoene dehydrogenase-like protein